jgi:hypothetical protein
MINGRLFVVINTHPPACRLASSDLSFLPFGWFDTSHCYGQVQILQSKAHVRGVDVLVCEDLWYLLKYWFVKAVPPCGGDHLRRHIQELHALATSFI